MQPKAQKNRDWEAQKPYSAYPARSGCFTVSRERAHSTEVESTTHTSSVHTLVSRASTPISQFIVAARARRRLL